MPRADQPRSPDIQIYRPQLTSVLSISHRLTGIILSFGSSLLVVALVAVSTGPHAFATVHQLATSPLGLILLFIWTFALFFHLCNGIRHLLWDAGYGFDLWMIYASGWAVVATSTVLTLATWMTGVWVNG